MLLPNKLRQIYISGVYVCAHARACVRSCVRACGVGREARRERERERVRVRVHQYPEFAKTSDSDIFFPPGKLFQTY